MYWFILKHPTGKTQINEFTVNNVTMSNQTFLALKRHFCSMGIFATYLLKSSKYMM